MSIITQCPSCGTTFRVTPPQLQAQHGMVRCGRCAQVFDGFKTLATLPDTASSAEAPQDILRETAPAAAVSAPLPAEPPPETGIVDSRTPVHAQAEPAASVKAAARVASESRSHANELGLHVEPPPYAQSNFAAPPPRRSGGGWAFGVLLMMVGLVAQGAYFYRSDIVASLPESRPYFARMCELLRCTVALPQRPRQISIEASDMQAPDPANPGVIALTATLRNHATTELGYPALDVVLTNAKDHTVARRIFLPAEYLAAGKDVRSGIAANAEVTVRLDLDIGELGAAGFRLDLIAAPAS